MFQTYTCALNANLRNPSTGLSEKHFEYDHEGVIANRGKELWSDEQILISYLKAEVISAQYVRINSLSLFNGGKWLKLTFPWLILNTLC